MCSVLNVPPGRMLTFKSCIHSWHTEEGNILNKWTGGAQGKALQEIIQRARFTGVGVWRWSLLFRTFKQSRLAKGENSRCFYP